MRFARKRGRTASGQTTLKSRVSLSGIGVHSGKPATATLRPADADTGIVFHRTDIADNVALPARFDGVGATELCTVLGDPRGVHVATVEHLVAALAGLGIDNVLIELDGPEVPVMDGSAQAFVDAIDAVGVETMAAPRRFIRVERPVRIEAGSSWAEFLPFDGRRFDIAIDYECSVVGKHALSLDLSAKSFRSIARARTFGYMRDVERLWSAGYALGSSFDNSVVIGEGAVVNPEGLRYPDEFVRHKLLDTIGDLALAGRPILGHFRSYKGGHRVNALALSALMQRPECWTLVSEPAVRETRSEGLADRAAALAAPLFAVEVA